MIHFEPPSTRGPRPTWWPWYVAYCLVVAVVHFLLGLLAAVIVAIPLQTPRPGATSDVLGSFAIFGVAFVAIAGLFAVAPWLPPRRWTYYLGMILLIWGWMIPPMILPGLWLLARWSRPEALAYFGILKQDTGATHS